MTPDPLQERVARVLHAAAPCLPPYAPSDMQLDEWEEVAAVVLADLREAGELRTLEQVGWFGVTLGSLGAFSPLEDEPVPGDVPVYIVREDTEPCPRGCKPEGATP